MKTENDLQIEQQLKIEKLYSNLRKVRIASVVEIYFYVTIFIFALFKYESHGIFRITDLADILTSPTALFGFVVIFFVILLFLLLSVTPFVWFIMRFFNRKTWRELTENEDVGSLQSSEAQIDQTKTDSPDPIDRVFIDYIERSRSAVRVAQRRPNVLLLSGATIAVAGLVFFVFTLQSVSFGVSVNNKNIVMKSDDFWFSLFQILPRTFMLIFIQLLAGFFLKQYRSSMEEFRYYEAVLRLRESQYLSYRVIQSLNDKSMLNDFTKEILKIQSFLTLSNGETTSILEAMKNEKNEFSEVIKNLTDAIGQLRKPNP